MPEKLERRPKIRRVWIGVPLAVLAVLGAAILIGPRRDEPSFRWLSPAEANRGWRGSLFESIEGRIMRWPFAARLLKSNKQLILLESKLVRFPKSIYMPDLNTHAIETNRNGDLAYLLRPDELTQVQVALASPAGNSGLGSKISTEDRSRNRLLQVVPATMRITTGHGMRSSISSGNSIPGVGFSGVSLDVFPKIRQKNFSLLLRAASSGPLTNSVPAVWTNFLVSCQAMVPNGGGLLIRHVDEMADPPVIYWLLKASAVDSKGNPIELGK